MATRELTGVYREQPRGRMYTRWVAVYRTGMGFTHSVLPIDANETEEEARAYALANPPA